MGEFTDKVVLVNGAGRTIGRSIAEAFATQGAIVAANDITPVNLDVTLERIRTVGGRTRDYVFDMAKKMAVQTLVDQVLADWGAIHILVNNTAVLPQTAILTMDEWDWHRSVDVNLGSPFFTMQSVARAMHQMGGGAIVNITISAGQAHKLKENAVYFVSRFGLIGLTRQAAQEFSPYKIRVNALCPGRLENEDPIGSYHARLDFPGTRLESHTKLVQAVLYLCSLEATHISGQTYYIDEGDDEGK